MKFNPTYFVYPGGMIMPGRFTTSGDYRYGYNGMEMDNETSGNGNSYTTEFRQYDPRLMRWKSLDPVVNSHQSPFCAMDNNPIIFNDLKGNDIIWGDVTGRNVPAKKDQRFIMNQLRFKRIFGNKLTRQVAKEIMRGKNDVYFAVLSTYHFLNYDPSTGELTGGVNYVGANTTHNAGQEIAATLYNEISIILINEYGIDWYNNEDAIRTMEEYIKNRIGNPNEDWEIPGVGTHANIDFVWDDEYLDYAIIENPNFETDKKKLRKQTFWHEAKHAYNIMTGNHKPRVEEERDATIFANEALKFDINRNYYISYRTQTIIYTGEKGKGSDKKFTNYIGKGSGLGTEEDFENSESENAGVPGY